MDFFPAWAKVNLGLEVREKRPDGYHNVRMVNQTVSLADRITIALRPKREGITLRITGAELPAGEQNLAYRAAELLQKRCGVRSGVQIELRKHIPVAAGLAGGSADAAAVLYGLNRLWGLNLKAAELMALALELGSDVPFALLGGTALAEGRGEVLTPLTPLLPCWFVLVHPRIEVSTAWAYAELDRCPPSARPDIPGLLAALAAGDLKGVAAHLGNSFQAVIEERYPCVAEAKRALLAEGALGACLTGSGPTVFGLFSEKIGAEKAAAALKGEMDTFVVRPVAEGAGVLPLEAVMEE
ncbi:MAG: 4-diphosphocytidyl-2-C-methyl-D-erythritol kinase [Bacillota bacterium]|jgi:4-diphosphocytidyl-2-C-methyl-D-erythritol kinase|nr:4-diphosphocytidyl-2-C-methyl-D-erythritol kinase [Bacillota bacterium]MDK2881846.1 4-diphosphocytidyl-2-C-methyl-D-erythritol kinase [Bacillota bacterium]MDK2960127.1 4-diphosphocytidyl-2-C-methyl-D-erythritol kinase [Bacillota bacterium]